MKLLNVLAPSILLTVIFLPACVNAKQTNPEATVPATDIAETTQELTPPSATSTLEGGTWWTYRSTQAGFTVEYPADWMVSEQVGEDGSIVTNFSSEDGSAGIMVLAQSGEFGGGGSDLPNTRCEEVKVGGLTGMRCFDTINLASSTTVVANGKTFTIAPLGKRMDESILSRFLSGFKFIN